jgi:MarR family 2-MHQ and catechol resistance regulon transcriptional repressor
MIIAWVSNLSSSRESSSHIWKDTSYKIHLSRANLESVNVRDLIWLGQRLADAGQSDIRQLAPGVPTAELIVMYDLLDHGPSTITDLAERTGYVQSRVSSAVVGLRERRWAETRSDPEDGRRTIVCVPEAVQRQASQVQARNANDEVLQPLLAELPARRRDAIIRALNDLHDLLRNHDDDRPARDSTHEVQRLLSPRPPG